MDHYDIPKVRDLSNVKICTRCIYDETIPGISFNQEGVCSFCEYIDYLKSIHKTGTNEGERMLNLIVDEIKRNGIGKKYDCVLGVSGGTDSSFMLHWSVANGLRPLAVHYDNTWNTAIATENIRKITQALKIDLFTYVVDNKEMDDIFKSFFRASVPELDAATDIGVAEVLYRACAKYNVKYILEGHSFMAEGVSPVGYMYADGMYIKSVQKLFGSRKIKTFPNMNFFSFLKWILILRIKKIRPLWYIDYSKEEARKLLESKYGWNYYGGHHLENRITAFHHSFWNSRKFNIDQRNNSLSACIRNGVKTRNEALEEYSKPPILEPDLIDYLLKRLGFTKEEFRRIMNSPNKNYKDYKTYKKRFERLRPLFSILAKTHLVPMSFYHKYCFPLPDNIK